MELDLGDAIPGGDGGGPVVADAVLFCEDDATAPFPRDVAFVRANLKGLVPSDMVKMSRLELAAYVFEVEGGKKHLRGVVTAQVDAVTAVPGLRFAARLIMEIGRAHV